jgi:hypothetical protein
MRNPERSWGSPTKPLFNPLEVATAIRENLLIDLGRAQSQMYGLSNVYTKYFAEVQANAILKKFVPPKDKNPTRREETLKKFLANNKRMGEVNSKLLLSLPSPNVGLAGYGRQDRILIRARWLCQWILKDISTEEIFHRCRHGDGSSVGVPFRDTSIDRKSLFPLTCTERVKRLFLSYLEFNPQLKSALLKHNAPNGVEDMFEIVAGSRAHTVLKTIAIDRFIAIEPTLNMFFQLGIMDIFTDRLLAAGLDVSSLQDLHKELARWSSVSGFNATVDFSMASDCNSTGFLRWFLPAKWFAWLDHVRCSHMSLDGELVELHMISTMGNATTFPVETLVLYCLAVASVMEAGKPNPRRLLSTVKERACVSVFGDDCILPTSSYDIFQDIAEGVGFIVNQEKSFYNVGPGFRESCGGDFYHMRNMRPFSLRAPSSDRRSAMEPWLYIILNRILPRYINYFGSLQYVYESRLLSYIFGLFERFRIKVKCVPDYFPDDAGLKTQDLARLRLNYRFAIERLKVDEQGCITFLFCQFKYWESMDKFPDIHYVEALKINRQRKLLKPIKDPDDVYRTRKKGGYVVARGFSPCWTVTA